jgi:peptidoglycan hydrolase CwlO-like protein
MKKRNKVILVLSITICLILAVSAPFFFIERQNVKKEKISLQVRFDELALNREVLTKAVMELEDSKRDAEEKLENSGKTIKNIFSQLDAEKKKNAESGNAIKEKDGEIKRLEAAIAKYREENENLSSRLEILNKILDIAESKLEKACRCKKEIPERNKGTKQKSRKPI